MRTTPAPVALLASVDTDWVTVRLARLDTSTLLIDEITWPTRPFLSSPDGSRLFEEIARRGKEILGTKGVIARVAIVAPGTIRDRRIIGRSTRLGITQRFDVAAFFKDAYNAPALVFNDTHARAVGEYSTLTEEVRTTIEDNGKTYAYILVDEGIGMMLMIDGEPHLGAGSAGALGRLVVEPDGGYSNYFRSRGALENYAARPWISQNIVAEFLMEQDKSGATPTQATKFRSQVATAAEHEAEWTSLSIHQIREGAMDNDPIALKAIDDAARHIGLALNAVITIANPSVLFLSGCVLDISPDLSRACISYARRHSWGAAWNKTRFIHSALGDEAAFLGAMSLLKELA